MGVDVTRLRFCVVRSVDSLCKKSLGCSFRFVPFLYISCYIRYYIFSVAGQLVSEGVNQVLKRMIRQPRPNPFSSLTEAQSCMWRSDSKSGGMPSDHCQYMAFLAIYCFNRFRSKSLSIVVCFPLALLTAYSRVYLSYHTIPQVIAGLAVGSLLGLLWAKIRRFTYPVTSWALDTFNILPKFNLN